MDCSHGWSGGAARRRGTRGVLAAVREPAPVGAEEVQSRVGTPCWLAWASSAPPGAAR